MLLSVTSRPGIWTFGYKKDNKKSCVLPSQQKAPPSLSHSTSNSSNGSNGNNRLSKRNFYIQGLPPGTTDLDLQRGWLCKDGVHREV
uniref:Uncharacterized protein n=1 Tax=Rhinolophus ferrumequinum TaxID=59479 RepID=A0A671EE33_RHIFE